MLQLNGCKVTWFIGVAPAPALAGPFRRQNEEEDHNENGNRGVCHISGRTTERRVSVETFPEADLWKVNNNGNNSKSSHDAGW